MPPEVKQNWDDNDYWTKAQILAYNTIRQKEEMDEETEKLKTYCEAAGAKIS